MHWILCNWNRWLTLFEWWIHFILECLRLFVSCSLVANLKHARISYVQLNKASTSQIIIHHFFLFLQVLQIKHFFFHYWQMMKIFEPTQKKRAKQMYDKTEKKQDWTGLFRSYRLCSEWQNDWTGQSFIFNWWLSKEFQSVPDNYLTTSWQMPDKCLTNVWQMLSTSWHSAKQNLILLLD